VADPAPDGNLQLSAPSLRAWASVHGALHPESDSSNGVSVTPSVDTQHVSMEIENKLAIYGTIDRWPTLTLLHSQFIACECGCPRLKHKLIGTQRMGCATDHGDDDCVEFRAPIDTDGRRRKRT
jgi:hypothetical protein